MNVITTWMNVMLGVLIRFIGVHLYWLVLRCDEIFLLVCEWKRGRVWLAFLLLNPLFVGLLVLFYRTVANSDTHCLLVDHRAFYLGLPLIKMQINFNSKDHIK